jgi:hypothetical protein
VAPNKSFYLLFSPGKKAFIFVGEGMKDKGRKKDTNGMHDGFNLTPFINRGSQFRLRKLETAVHAYVQYLDETMIATCMHCTELAR